MAFGKVLCVRVSVFKIFCYLQSGYVFCENFLSHCAKKPRGDIYVRPTNVATDTFWESKRFCNDFSKAIVSQFQKFRQRTFLVALKNVVQVCFSSSS